MASRTYSVCGIEIGRESLCVAHYVPAENAITGIAIQPLETGRGTWWDTVTAEFRGLIGTMKLAGVDVACSLPAENAVIKRLTIDADAEDPAAALDWELGQNVIGLPEEYVFDFQRSGDEGTPTAAYLVAASRAVTVDRVQKLIAGHKLNPVVVDLDVFALANVFELSNPEASVKPAILVLGGDEYTKVILVEAGSFIDYEMFRNESNAMDPRQYAGVLKNNIGRIISLNGDLAGRGGLPAIFAAGPLFSHEEFSRPCLAELGGAKVLAPFAGVICRAVPAEDLQKYSAQLAVAVGLALRGSADQLS
jgi:hypothetical protein